MHIALKILSTFLILMAGLKIIQITLIKLLLMHYQNFTLMVLVLLIKIVLWKSC